MFSTVQSLNAQNPRSVVPDDTRVSHQFYEQHALSSPVTEQDCLNPDSRRDAAVRLASATFKHSIWGQWSEHPEAIGKTVFMQDGKPYPTQFYRCGLNNCTNNDFNRRDFMDLKAFVERHPSGITEVKAQEEFIDWTEHFLAKLIGQGERGEPALEDVKRAFFNAPFPVQVALIILDRESRCVSAAKWLAEREDDVKKPAPLAMLACLSEKPPNFEGAVRELKHFEAFFERAYAYAASIQQVFEHAGRLQNLVRT